MSSTVFCLLFCCRVVDGVWEDYCARIESQTASERFGVGRKSIGTFVPLEQDFHVRRTSFDQANDTLTQEYRDWYG